MNTVWVGIAAVAAVSSALLGAGFSWNILTRRGRLRERRLVASAQEQYATGTRGLRASNTRLQVELETERASLQRRVATGIAEQRAANLRLEEQLRFAYMEVDRLKTQLGGGKLAAERAGDGTGFALTQPYVP